MDPRLRKSEDGWWAANRGKPPVCPEGFMNHPTNPYRCIQEVCPCDDRTVSEFLYPPCGCKQSKVECAMLDRNITIAVCGACLKKGRQTIMDKLGDGSRVSESYTTNDPNEEQ